MAKRYTEKDLKNATDSRNKKIAERQKKEAEWMKLVSRGQGQTTKAINLGKEIDKLKEEIQKLNLLMVEIKLQLTAGGNNGVKK